MSGGFPTSANFFGTPSAALGSQSPYLTYSSSQLPSQRIKLKRTRQRVDAGEPRNNYSTIPTFSPVRGMPLTNPQPYTAPHIFSSSPSVMADSFNRLFGSFDPPPTTQPPSNFLGGPVPPSWFRHLPEETEKLSGSHSQGSNTPMSIDVSGKAGVEQQQDAAGLGNGSEKIENGNHAEEGAGSPCKVCDENGVQSDSHAPSGEAEDSLGMSPVESKKARVENIISTISGPSSPSQSIPDDKASGGSNSEPNSKNSSPKSRRKQYQPQQVEEGLGEEEVLTATVEEEDRAESAMDSIADEDEKKEATDTGKNLSKVQEILALQHQFYVDWVAQQQKEAAKRSEEKVKEDGEEFAPPAKLPKLGLEINVEESQKQLKSMAQSLKTELMSAVSSTVDKIFSDYLAAEAARINQQRLRATAEQAAATRTPQGAVPPRPFYNPFYSFPYGNSFGMMPNNAPPNSSIFPGFATPYLNATGLGAGGGMHHRKDDSFSLIMQKKKRSKVTDTRVTKMPLRGDESSRSSPTGYFPPTMVGHPLYGSTFAGLEDREAESPTNSDDPSDMGTYDPAVQSTTLTPMHLRKAKLMFFYTRYPSSQLLKSYFPDIHFKKETTAQLVKWFSNFREFYYIQMEKYARQALAEGIRRPEEIYVTLESELYKVLNQHYNRNNHIPVPAKYREVVEATLREFFVAIQNGKDAEASWKKQIYKVIARLDDSIPDYFKNPNFLEQLE